MVTIQSNSASAEGTTGDVVQIGAVRAAPIPAFHVQQAIFTPSENMRCLGFVVSRTGRMRGAE